MSIFGQLDAANIPANPYFIEAGDYFAEVTKAEIKKNRDGQRQIAITYTIRDENSQYNKSSVTQYFNLVDSDMTAEKLALLPAEEQQKIRKTNAALKRTLCGNAAVENQHGLGVNIDDLNDPSWDPAVVVGTFVNIGIANYGTDGVNVRWVNLADA